MKIAGVQMDVSLGQTESNLERMLESIRITRAEGAELTVFPECALTGYCFENYEEALPFTQPIPGPATEAIQSACEELGGFVVFGMLERSEEKIYNAAVLVGAEGVIGSYRKIHLPYLGVDQFTTFGDRPFEVQEAGNVRIGMNICYDSAFPESSRILTIKGADLIVLPTNWPPGAECVAANALNTRAMENGVYYIAVNRVGTERGFSFIGLSRICDPSGNTLATSTGTDEEILYAEIHPEKARRKHIVRVPGLHEIDRMADRRPEMYGLLCEPHDLKRPGRG